LLLDNGYPLDLIFNKMNSRLKKLFVQRMKTAADTTSKTLVLVVANIKL